MPGSRANRAYLEVDAHFKNMGPAGQYGPEYLTYVLWAITPEGRPKNLGEVVLNGSINSKLDVTTELQAFGLIVTAEPYYAVTMPSDVVVMENIIRTDTVGKIEEIDAKYELLPRGQYTMNVAAGDLRKRAVADPKRPLEVLEARNAVQIAQWAGADRYASDTYQKALALLDDAEIIRLESIGEEACGYDRAGSRADRRGCPVDHGEADRRGAAGQGEAG